MAIRKAIVLDDNGNLSELPSGDQIVDPTPEEYNGTAGENLADRDAVYMKGDGKVYKAKASASGTMPCFGFVDGAAVADGDVKIRLGGVMDGFSGLTVGGVYFVSDAVAGAITTTAPTGANKVVQKVAIAMSATEIVIQKAPVVLRT